MKNFAFVVFVIAALVCSCGGGGGGSNTNNPGGSQQFNLPDITGKWLLSLYEPGKYTVSGTVNWVITQTGNSVTVTNPKSPESTYTFTYDRLTFKVVEITKGNPVNWAGTISSDGKLMHDGTFIGSGPGGWSGTFTAHKE